MQTQSLSRRLLPTGKLYNISITVWNGYPFVSRILRTYLMFCRLLIALAHHAIEVRDLSDQPKPTYMIPTVDQVIKLSYCTSGNYIVTLETKQKRSCDDFLYVRVYCNWEQCSQGTPPLRVRIAGRVTPTGSQIGDNALDMIEIPIKFTTVNAFACCQVMQNNIFYYEVMCMENKQFPSILFLM